MPVVDFAAVLQITDKDYELIEVRADAEAYRVFCYCLAIGDYQNGAGKSAIGVSA
jgi:hypothetical protein